MTTMNECQSDSSMDAMMENPFGQMFQRGLDQRTSEQNHHKALVNGMFDTVAEKSVNL